jgi:hypothetical protein
MTQKGCCYGPGGHPHGTIDIPAISGNHQRTRTAMPWQGFDFALQNTDHPRGIEGAGHLVKADTLIVDFTAPWKGSLS